MKPAFITSIFPSDWKSQLDKLSPPFFLCERLRQRNATRTQTRNSSA